MLGENIKVPYPFETRSCFSLNLILLDTDADRAQQTIKVKLGMQII